MCFIETIQEHQFCAVRSLSCGRRGCKSVCHTSTSVRLGFRAYAFVIYIENAGQTAAFADLTYSSLHIEN